MNKNALESEIVKLINLFNEKRFDEVIDFTSAILGSFWLILIIKQLPQILFRLSLVLYLHHYFSNNDIRL